MIQKDDCWHKKQICSDTEFELSRKEGRNAIY